MNLTDARLFVRYSARNAGSSTQYSDPDVDRAIQVAADQFILRTRSTRTTSSFTITADTSTVSFSTVTNFRPERLIRAWIPAAVGWLEPVEHQDLLKLQIDSPQTATLPTLIAFESYTTAELYPTPSAGYTGKVQWVQPFTTWAPGADASTVTSFNLPDEYLRTILTSGAAYELQKNEPEHVKFTQQRKAEFEAFVLRMLGRGGTGSKTALRYRED